MMPATVNGSYSRYYSQAAQDSALTHGSDYADAVEISALEHAAYYVLRGDLENAQRMLTQSLGESLIGNDGN